MKAAQAALAEAFGRQPVMIRCGASVPVAEMMQRVLGIDPVLMGLGLPDDNLHSPNEKFDLDQLWQGAHACAMLLQTFAEQQKI
jgi:acetylornithine deacetylase/succinyl-diaminopimelate desuccinylase-like protein